MWGIWKSAFFGVAVQIRNSSLKLERSCQPWVATSIWRPPPSVPRLSACYLLIFALRLHVRHLRSHVKAQKLSTSSQMSSTPAWHHSAIRILTPEPIVIHPQAPLLPPNNDSSIWLHHDSLIKVLMSLFEAHGFAIGLIQCPIPETCEKMNPMSAARCWTGAICVGIKSKRDSSRK